MNNTDNLNTENSDDMAKIGEERTVTITLKLSTWKKLKQLNIERKFIDQNLSDTINYLLEKKNINSKQSTD